jgi:hypothetical protein
MRAARLFLALGLMPVLPALSQEPGRLEVCADQRHLCRGGKPVFLVGYSDYGAFSRPYDYEAWLDKLQRSGVNLMREWASPYPLSWGGVQPYLFEGGRARLDERFWQNAERFCKAAEARGQVVLVDLLDHYGLEAARFGDNPLAQRHKGPLERGLPDAYDLSGGSSAVLEMMRLGVTRLAASGCHNLVLQVVNEPRGFRSERQIRDFHAAAVAMIRAAAPGCLVAVNPVSDAEGRPDVPSAQAIGADLVTIHGAGVVDPADPESCSAEAVARRLASVWELIRRPIVADTDGLRGPRCGREDKRVLAELLRGARQEAGFNHRDFEPSSKDGRPDRKALAVLSGARRP